MIYVFVLPLCETNCRFSIRIRFQLLECCRCFIFRLVWNERFWINFFSAEVLSESMQQFIDGAVQFNTVHVLWILIAQQFQEKLIIDESITSHDFRAANKVSIIPVKSILIKYFFSICFQKSRKNSIAMEITMPLHTILLLLATVWSANAYSSKWFNVAIRNQSELWVNSMRFF